MAETKWPESKAEEPVKCMCIGDRTRVEPQSCLPSSIWKEEGQASSLLHGRGPVVLVVASRTTLSTRREARIKNSWGLPRCQALS